MLETIFIGAELTLIQLSSAYLRYLPFAKDLTEREVCELRKKFLLWSAAGFALNIFFFADGTSYRAYKSAFSAGWIPYFLLSLTVIRGRLPQNIFVLGMQLLWAFMLHSFAGMGVALIFGKMAEEFLPLQLFFYLIGFVVLLKVEKKFFSNLLPAPKLFEDPSLKWCISILPLAIFVGTVILIADVTFLPTWKERFSRLFLPIFFLLIYRSMSITTRRIAEQHIQEQRTDFLTRQVDSLREHNALMQKSQREVADLQKNLDENYRVIDGLLAEEKISEAMKYIRRQSNFLQSSSMKVFCLAPLMNAALSIYLKRAEDAGIKVSRKIDLPEKFSTNESDLAVLLSNLLENAINASKKQQPSDREISLIIRQSGGQYILEISNRYDFPIPLNENGLPYTPRIGHGLGMTSLALFAEKYGAYVDFSHENKLVRLSMYWTDV